MALSKCSIKSLFFAASKQRVRFYSAPGDRSIPPSKQKYVPTSGTYPKGFLAGSAHAGVKPSNTEYDDLALLASEIPCAAAATFTRNLFKAAPVTFSMDVLRMRSGAGIRGVVINSGCANAVTGRGGLKDAEAMAKETDRCFGTRDDADEKPSTLVMSTGIIGQRLPIDKITSNLSNLHASLGSTHEHWLGAAKAICTTDTFPKLLSRTFTLPSHPETIYSIAGMAKGAGMIHPNMATLLSIVCTDAAIEPSALRHMNRKVVNSSFNCISIDGDTSTNDTVALFANGAAAPPGTTPISQKSFASVADYNAMRDVLSTFMVDLAQLVVRDGEGATKFITIRVRSDRGFSTAKRVAVSIAKSALVKTALYGKDANWGRILCAVGYAPGILAQPGVPRIQTSAHYRRKPAEATPQVDPARTSVSFIPADGSEELKLLVRGEPETVDEERAKQILEQEDLEILVRLEDGPPSVQVDVEASETDTPNRVFECTFWTCDFSHEYVTINGDYRT